MHENIQTIKRNILIRANRNCLLQSGAVLFELLPQSTQAMMTARCACFYGEEMLIVLYHNEHKWTVVSTHRVFSFYEKTLSLIELNGIKKVIALTHRPDEIAPPSQELKVTGEYLCLSKSIYIWAPSGAAIFGLWNLLLMFK